MKKFIIGLIGVMFVSAMAFSLSSCSKEEVEPGKDEDEVTILGTWRCYEDEAKGYYKQITLEEDGILIWREVDERENETLYATYTYENENITFYEGPNKIDCIWHVEKLSKTRMVTYRVNKNDGTYGRQEIWTRVE